MLLDKEPQNMPLSFVLITYYWAWGMGHAFSCGLYPPWDSVGKKKFFFCECLPIGSSFWVRDGDFCSCLLSVLGPLLAKTLASVLHAATVSVCTGPALFRRPCSLVSPIPFGPCKLFSMLLGPWPIWFQVPGLSRLKALDHPSNVGYGFHFMEWALKPVRYWLVTSRGFEPLLY